MLIAKGYRVRFKLKSGRVVAPAGAAMMHDPSGTDWPSDSVLIASIKKGRQPVSDSAARDYFGYDPHGADFDTPPKTDGWKKDGIVERITYWRPGTEPHSQGGRRGNWKHTFKDEGWWIFAAVPPVLSRRGRMLRLDFPAGCTLNWRGFVYP